MKKDVFSRKVAFIAAAISSLCCLGPLIFIALGLSIGGFSIFEKYRPLFIFITIGFLVIAFYYTYKKQSIACEDGSCKFVSGSRTEKIALWIITILAVIFMLVPYWLPYLVGKEASNKFNNEQLAYISHESILIDIHDMYCPVCAKKIQKRLQELDGVLFANVNYEEKMAIVKILPNQLSNKTLIDVINSEGYTADVRSRDLVKALQKKELQE